MSPRDFCSPVPQFAEWSHPPTGGRAHAGVQWVMDKERKRLLDFFLQSAVAIEEVNPALKERDKTLEQRFLEHANAIRFSSLLLKVSVLSCAKTCERTTHRG
jgi:hypothetical protein